MGSIKDKVAIVGMGCTQFGELWEKGVPDLIIDASYEACEDAGITPQDVDAVVIANLTSGMVTAAPAAEALQLQGKPISRVENNCASGAEALRIATLSVASGMYDTVLAIGFEKCKDFGSGALDAPGTVHPVSTPGSAPASFAKAAVQYCQKYGISRDSLKRAIAKIAVKNHYNGALHPKAHFRKQIVLEAAINAPIIAWPLGVFDCCPVTDGGAAAVVTRADNAKNFRDNYILIKGMGLSVSRVNPCQGRYHSGYDITFFEETGFAAQQAYDQAGIKNPRKELSLAEVHDCFTITELIIYESLGLSPRGGAIADVDAGNFTLQGDMPVNTDGGLKAFGHPVGASGIRMVYESYNQILGRAGKRQLKNPTLGLSLVQGGTPGQFQSACTIVGPRD